ncbi:MAG: hypothetical protein WC458_01875 [Patescibacteria group bacterium]
MNQETLEQQIISLQKRVEDLEKKISNNTISPNISEQAKELSLKEFILTKKANNDVKRTLLIGYFLEKFKGADSFNSKDIEDGFRTAKMQAPQNINDKINMNIGNGHVMEHKEKKDSRKAWVLTALGETYVQNDLK